MRIQGSLDKDVEVTVSVTAEDIRCALQEDTESEQTVLHCLNDFARFLKAIPDEIIIGMNDVQKDAIRKFLTEQAVRFCQ